MTEFEANQLVDMLKEHWNMFIGTATREMWVDFLLDKDAEVATKAVVKLAGYMKTEPKISDVKEVMSLLAEKVSALPPAGTCPTCHGDRYVLVATREPRQSLWMHKKGIEPKASERIEEYAPCPDCNTTVDTSFKRGTDGTPVRSPDPARVREMMGR